MFCNPTAWPTIMRYQSDIFSKSIRGVWEPGFYMRVPHLQKRTETFHKVSRFSPISAFDLQTTFHAYEINLLFSREVSLTDCGVKMGGKIFFFKSERAMYSSIYNNGFFRLIRPFFNRFFGKNLSKILGIDCLPVLLTIERRQ